MHGAAAPLAPQTGPSTTAAAVPLPLARNSSSSAALGAPRAQPRATTRLAKARAAVLGLLSCGSIAPATAPAPAPAGPDAAGNGGAGKPPLPPSDKGHGQQHPVVAACAVGHGGKQGSAAAGCIAAPLAAWFSGGSPRANRCRIAAAALLLVAVLVAAIVPAVVLKAGQKSSAQQEQPAPGQPGQGGVPPGGAGPSTPKRNVSQAFVHVNDDLQLERECRPFVVVGFNAHDLPALAQVSPGMYATLGNRSGRAAIAEVLDEAKDLGINTVRTWAHSSDPLFPFQVGPGLYFEPALRGLDWVVARAAASGLHVVLSFVDNWKYYNGVDQYVDWSATAPVRRRARPLDTPGDPMGLAGLQGGGAAATAASQEQAQQDHKYEAQRHALFWSDPGARALYRNHVATIINRRNTYNGRLYRDDPAVLAWSLANEPRCETWAAPACAQALQSWISEMSAYVRQLDPNHLISIGSEGFFGRSTPSLLSKNPAPWAADMGQDFVAHTALPDIDFATLHAWPDNWAESGHLPTGFMDSWLASHLAAAAQLRKPLLLEEFGKKVVLTQAPPPPPPPAAGAAASEQGGDVAGAGGRDAAQPQRAPAADIAAVRDPDFQATYDSIERFMGRGGGAPAPLVGSLFWKWEVRVFGDSIPDQYGVQLGDPALGLVARHAAFVASLTDVRRRQGCTASCWVTIPSSSAAGGQGGAASAPAVRRSCAGGWQACELGFGLPPKAPAADPPADWQMLAGADLGAAAALALSTAPANSSDSAGAGAGDGSALEGASGAVNATADPLLQLPDDQAPAPGVSSITVRGGQRQGLRRLLQQQEIAGAALVPALPPLDPAASSGTADPAGRGLCLGLLAPRGGAADDAAAGLLGDPDGLAQRLCGNATAADGLPAAAAAAGAGAGKAGQTPPPPPPAVKYAYGTVVYVSREACCAAGGGCS